MPRWFCEVSYWLFMVSFLYFQVRLIFHLRGWTLWKKKFTSTNIRMVAEAAQICPTCQGTGFDDYDRNGDPIDFCEKCDGWGKLHHT